MSRSVTYVDGRTGRPLRTFLAFADRLEVSSAWSFSSGHAEWYVDGERVVVLRDAHAEIEWRFGAELAAAIARGFVDLDE